MSDTIALIELSQSGDKKAREKLMEENMGLVYHVVKRFVGRNVEEEDLVQIGCIGLMKAIDHFNLQYEVRFSTYAVPMIMGEIRRFLRDDGMIQVSRTIRENGTKVRRKMEELSQKGGGEITLLDAARETGLSMEEVVTALDAACEVDSIHKTIYEGDGKAITLEEQLPSGRDEQEEIINKIVLDGLLQQLSVDERQLLYFRYFEDITQTEIAKKLGISQVQVSRTEKKLLLKMRNAL